MSDKNVRDRVERARNTFRSSMLLLGGCAVIFPVLLNLISQDGAWQLFVLLGCTVVMSIAFSLSAMLARRGRPGLAAWLMIGTLWLVIFISSAMLDDMGLMYAAMTVLLTITVAGQTLPARKVWQATAASLVVACGVLLIDQLGLLSQLSIPQLQIFTPIAGSVFILLFGYAIAHELGANSIQMRIALWAGLCLLPAVVVLIGYETISLRNTALKDAENEALITAQSYAAYIEEEIESALDAGRTLAQALSVVKRGENPVALGRDQVNAMLKQVLEDNPNFLGTYTLWEPNAFDGLDAQYVNAEAHDETGRFIPYWVRGEGGQIHVEALLEYETEGIGDWYLLPKKTHQEQVLDPFLYPIQGQEVLLTSLVTPIVVEGQFYGIAGVDLNIDALQKLADEAHVYDGDGKLALISHNGTLAGVTGQPEYVGQLATALDQDYRDDLAYVERGTRHVHYHEDELAVFVPLRLGRTETPWSVNVLVPMEKITTRTTALLWRMVGGSALLMLLTLALLWFAAGRVARPVKAITGVAQAVAGGNLAVEAQVMSGDEVGTLAIVFNDMTAQLRQMLGGLERRVVERTRVLELAADVGQHLSAIRDLDTLLAEAAALIRSRLDLYHVQIYLTDPTGRNLALRAGTGEAGVALVRRGHALPVGPGSINGAAATQKRPVVVPDTTQGDVFAPNSLLPGTRSALALPLLVGQRLVGVLNLQHDQPGSLDVEMLPGLEVLSGQLAAAIENANLFTATAQAWAEVEVQMQRLTGETWSEFLDGVQRGERLGYSFSAEGLQALTKTLAGTPAAHVLAAPIQVRDVPVGAIRVEGGAGRTWTQDETRLVESVARQVAQHVENLRLLAQAEQYRLQAEQASRRLTRQGWQDYLETQELGAGFFYDRYAVRPLAAEDDEAPLLTQALEVRGEAIGELSVGEVEVLDEEAVELLATVAERLGAHIENLRLLEETERRGYELQERGQELEASQRVTFAAAETASPDDLLDLVVNLIRDQFDLYHAQVYLVDGEKQAAVLRKSTGYAGRQLLERGHQIPLEQAALVTKAIRQGEPVLLDDVSQDEDWLPNPLLPHTRSELVLPLKARKGVIGALDVQSRTSGRFGPGTVALFQTMAEQVAMSFENVDLLARTTEQAEDLLRFTTQLRTAAEIAARLSAIHDPQQLIQEIVTLIQSRFGLYHAHVYLLDEAAHELVVSAGSGEVGRVLVERGHSIPLDMEKSLVARAARRQEIRVVNDTSLVSDFVPNPLLPQTRSEIAVPLVAGERVLGVLDVQDDRTGRFSQADVDTFSTLAGQIAISLQNAASFEAQKRAEDTLRENQALLAGIIDNTTAVVYVKDPGGRYLLVNRQFESLFDVRREEVIGKTDYDIFPQESADGFREHDLRVLHTRTPQRSEDLVPQSDGMHTYISIKFPLLDPAGRPYAVGGISTDITERERFTAQLRAIADLSVHINALLDPDQILQEVAIQLHDRLGFSHVHGYLLDRETRELVLRAYSGEVGRTMLESGYRFSTERQGSPVARAVRQRELVLVDDTEAEPGLVPNPLLPHTRSIVAVPLVAGDETLGVLNVQDDRPNHFGPTDLNVLSTLSGQVSTALQNAAFVKEIQSTSQRLRETARIKDRFMSSMSHELRTPLNSIIGFSEVLSMGISGELPAEAQEDVQAIFENGQHLLGIINDLLDLAKIESGTLALHPEPIEIAKLFDEVKTNNAGLLVDKAVEMRVQVEDDLPLLQADPIRVNQVLNNLVSNAAKFTDAGSITLRAYRDDDWVCLEVQDTGAGISADNLEKIFERFQQTDDDHARSAKGTGLGLDITRQLVELHGGTIAVRSQPGEGSTFRVRLPIA